MADDGLWSSNFTDLAPRIARGDVSPVALTELMLERISRFDDALRSYVTVAAEPARHIAAEREREIGAGHVRGPLHGVPIAVKDVFYTTGIATGLGSSVYADFKPPYESTATQRLHDAGAVLIGKLVATEGIYADHHPSIPPPINPFDSAYWTGTSSSGSGVAVTAGLCYGTIATDTGGSIRLPSACCGVTGIKPTWGRVSRYGVFPLAESLDHVGTMARNAADAAALLVAIAGSDPNDPTALPDAVPDLLAQLGDGVAGVRIGIDRAFIDAKADQPVRASIDAVVDAMTSAGASFVNVAFPPSDAALIDWALACAVEAALAHRDTYPARRAEYGDRLAALLERGHAATARDVALAAQRRRDFNGRMALLFSGIDALLVPALPVAGPTLAFMASLGEDPAAILAIGPFTAPFDICGYPTITVPCGANDAGVPIGVQFAGNPLSEPLLCRLGHAYQNVTDWHRRRPALAAA